MQASGCTEVFDYSTIRTEYGVDLMEYYSVLLLTYLYLILRTPA
jgi:hypothetical protein